MRKKNIILLAIVAFATVKASQSNTLYLGPKPAASAPSNSDDYFVTNMLGTGFLTGSCCSWWFEKQLNMSTPVPRVLSGLGLACLAYSLFSYGKELFGHHKERSEVERWKQRSDDAVLADAKANYEVTLVRWQEILKMPLEDISTAVLEDPKVKEHMISSISRQQVCNYPYCAAFDFISRYLRILTDHKLALDERIGKHQIAKTYPDFLMPSADVAARMANLNDFLAHLRIEIFKSNFYQIEALRFRGFYPPTSY